MFTQFFSCIFEKFRNNDSMKWAVKWIRSRSQGGVRTWPEQQGVSEAIFKRSLLELVTRRLFNGHSKFHFNKETGLGARLEHRANQQEIDGRETGRETGEEG